MKKRLLGLLIPLFLLTGCWQKRPAPLVSPSPQAVVETRMPELSARPEETEDTVQTPEISLEIDETGTYDTKDEVALYLYEYGHLPGNYMTKKEARKKGWKGGSLHLVVRGMCIGGDEFSNFEETLPVKEDRTYYECDIDTLKSKKRGAKRIVYSNDGLIYYTEDHYETFELLYGEPEDE